MVGTMGDVSVGDAIVKKIPGFDTEIAFAAIRKDAFEVPPSSTIGRECLNEYVRLGFVSRTCADESVSRTLNYYQSDYVIAQAAEVLGYKQDAALLSKRFKNFDKMFDSRTGFFRPKYVTGTFAEVFDQYTCKCLFHYSS